MLAGPRSVAGIYSELRLAVSGSEKNVSEAKHSSDRKQYSSRWENFCSRNICFLQRNADVDNVCLQQAATPPSKRADHSPVAYVQLEKVWNRHGM